MKELMLSQGKTTIIDDEDFEEISQFNWCVGEGYATRSRRKSEGRGPCSIYLHRVLMGLHPGDEREVDHVNANKLDNRRSNLRICTHQENMMNLRKYRKGTSVYKGVHFHKIANKWEAKIKLNNKRLYLGLFTSEQGAARAYDEAAQENFEGFASLNAV